MNLNKIILIGDEIVSMYAIFLGFVMAKDTHNNLFLLGSVMGILFAVLFPPLYLHYIKKNKNLH